MNAPSEQSAALESDHGHVTMPSEQSAQAAALGRMGRGVPKRLSDAERARRAAAMRALNAKRDSAKSSPVKSSPVAGGAR